MKESSTYQAILEEGREEGRKEGRREGALAEARKILRMWGDALFGAPDIQTAAAIEQIEELARLEDLIARLEAAKSWQELLDPPAGSPRKGRRRRSP
jgi:predicted transposase YdaD